jgi:hypothetical protein
MYNIVELILERENQISRLQKECTMMKSSIGMSQIYYVYSKFMDNYTKKLASHKKMLEEHGMGKDLIIIEKDGKKYSIIFDFVRNYKLGEYHPISELETLLDESAYDKIKTCLFELETLFINNTQNVYESLPVFRKKTHEELRRVIKSQKKQYLYYYPSKPLRDLSMGFIIVEK